MYKQDKATTERHARILKELVKSPENKTCADCKRQDARWSSWNIGVFICIRCSGIHRGMGTHISKVKSVDLDTWTPEQMESIQRWGNHRANLYWEAHLRPGHVPPEHKLESFIRSKYESRRWAREGPPPSDPSELESTKDLSVVPNPDTSVPASEPPSSLYSRPAVTSGQPQPHRLLSASFANRPLASQPVQPTLVDESKTPDPNTPRSTPQSDLFSLDFHAPTSSTMLQQTAPRKDVKNDILSLFSASPPAATSVSGQTTFGQFGGQKDQLGHWNQPQVASQVQPQTISMIGTGGVAMWGSQSGWTPNIVPAQPDLWGGFQNASGQAASGLSQQTSLNGLLDAQNVWGSSNNGSAQAAGGRNDLPGPAFGSTPASSSATQKKDDIFGDLWGDSK